MDTTGNSLELTFLLLGAPTLRNDPISKKMAPRLPSWILDGERSRVKSDEALKAGFSPDIHLPCPEQGWRAGLEGTLGRATPATTMLTTGGAVCAVNHAQSKPMGVNSSILSLGWH